MAVHLASLDRTVAICMDSAPELSCTDSTQDHFRAADGLLGFAGVPVALVGEVVSLISGPLPPADVVLGPVQGCGALGQPGSGSLQRLLGLLGPRLGCPNPGVVDRLGRDALALGRLDDLLGKVGQLARGRPGSCGCGRRIRVARSVLELAPILCAGCAQPFEPDDDPR
jgi:hypothetical protein